MVTRRDMIGLAVAGLAGTALESQGAITKSSLALRGAMMGGVKKPESGWAGLKFTAEEDNSSVSIVHGESAPDLVLLVSWDNGSTWVDWPIASTLTLQNAGDSVCVKAGEGGNSAFSTHYLSANLNYFAMTGRIKASGNIMSVLDGDMREEYSRLIDKSCCLALLFWKCTSLTQAPELPATILFDHCYYGMFKGCTSLTQAPELPATVLADHCYNTMFYGCTSLTQAPELPVMTLRLRCYNGMFQDCTSLTQAPELPAVELVNECYYNMFRNCTSLTQAPELPATTLATSCYNCMFYGCTSLTQAPELPATTLAASCYSSMFRSCSSLKISPELPATTLATGCYNYLFYLCKNVNNIKIHYTSKFSSTYFSNWVQGVSSQGTFYYNGSSTTRGTSAIPSGWDIVKF